ncbi:MAG: AhpC/TSA family protein [Xanthomonadales bacterium]|nr:AhpC/TSA family protein [Xanthomonadales bacterium]
MKTLLLKGVLLILLLGPTSLTALAQFQRTDIHDEASQVQPLLPGMKAAGFDVLDVQGNPVHFDPDNMNKPLVLTFFRGGWCPYCNLHLAELRKAEEELKASGFDIWFVSIDQPEMLYESLQQPDIGYTIFSDSKLSATRAYGLAFRMTDEMVEKYLEWNIDLEGASGETHHVLPAPSTFIIGTDGVIQFQYTNPDYKVRLHPEVLLTAARVYTDGANDRLQRAQKASREK